MEAQVWNELDRPDSCISWKRKLYMYSYNGHMLSVTIYDVVSSEGGGEEVVRGPCVSGGKHCREFETCICLHYTHRVHTKVSTPIYSFCCTATMQENTTGGLRYTEQPAA